MAAYPIPLVPPYTLWLSASDHVAQGLQSALTTAVAPHGFDVKDLRTSPNALIRAQAVFHDIRTLLRETDSLTALWSIASGHGDCVIIAAIDQTSHNAGQGFETFGVPAKEARFRLATVHRHLLSDRPDIVTGFHACLQQTFGDVEIGLSEDKLLALQAEADAFYAIRLIPTRVDIRKQSVQVATSKALTLA